MNPAWYDAVYYNDPSTDNIFGREALVERRDPLLHAYLRRGGALHAFARERTLTASLDRALYRLILQQAQDED